MNIYFCPQNKEPLGEAKEALIDKRKALNKRYQTPNEITVRLLAHSSAPWDVLECAS